MPFPWSSAVTVPTFVDGGTPGGKSGGGNKGTGGSSGRGPPPQPPGMAQLPNTLAAQARLLPIAYGRVKALAYLIEMSPPTSRQPGKWDLQHYSVGVVLASDGGAWKC